MPAKTTVVRVTRTAKATIRKHVDVTISTVDGEWRSAEDLASDLIRLQEASGQPIYWSEPEVAEETYPPPRIEAAEVKPDPRPNDVLVVEPGTPLPWKRPVKRDYDV